MASANISLAQWRVMANLKVGFIFCRNRLFQFYSLNLKIKKALLSFG